MGEENSKKTKNSDHHVSRMLGWISSKFNGVTRHHLEGVAATIIFTCIFVFVSKNKSKEHEQNKGDSHRTLRRSQSLGALHGGRVAIQRILDAQHASVNPKVLDEAEEELNALLDKDHSDQINFSELQSVVAKLEMSGKEVQGVKKLSEAQKNAEDNGHYHDAYELEMLVVEMLIYMGAFEEALKRKCLQDQEISDARQPLYKTVIQVLLGHDKDAEEYWNEFQKIRNRFQLPDCFHDVLDHSVARDFDKFKETVNFLKKEIVDARKKPK